MRPVYFNGKFYAAGLNGVHRVADRLIREIDRHLAALPEGERPVARLLLPKSRKWTPTLTAIELVEEPKGHSQVWEQFILPGRARDGLLVNLCNLAPVLHRHKLMMLHDAQFLFPDNSYPARLRWGYRLLTPWMARTSLRVLTISEYSRQMLDLFGVSPRERTDVIANGADHMLEVAADDGLPARLGLTRGRYAVHIASPKAYKNSAVLFEAFANGAMGDIRLALVGPDQAQLEKAGLKPPAGAVFAGRVDDAGLRALYEQALCVLMPSRTEGFGLPPVEAMTCGCPAVISPAGAMPEVCRDAVLYADVADPAGWRSQVLRLANDPALRQAKIDQGRARAAEFTWDAAGRTLLAMIQAAI